MKSSLLIPVLLSLINAAQALQLPWGQVQPVTGQQAPLPVRQPIGAELQNQVNALSAQLAAANRQLQYFQQQLSMVAQQQQVLSKPQQSLQYQPLSSPQVNLAQAQQLHAASQPRPAAQPEAQQPVSTLVDNESGQQQFAGQQPGLFFQPTIQQPAQQLQQPQHQSSLRLVQQQSFQPAPESTSTTPSPASIEPSAVEPEPQPEAAPQPVPQAPPADAQAPHNPPRNDDKFSIGLGVLSPGYTQKFGNTALDFNQDKNGFSFTLSNNGHNNQQAPQVSSPSQQPK